MSCIAGIVDGDAVWIGADSAGVSGYELTVRADPKVFHVGEYLFGFTSSYRMGQLLGHSLKPPMPAPGDGLWPFMATRFVDAVRACLKAGGYAVRHDEQESGGVFLVGVRGRLFRVESDYQVAEPADGYDACGCGEGYAKGSLFSTRTLAPRDRIHLALEAAERHSAGVRGPFVIRALAWTSSHLDGGFGAAGAGAAGRG